MIRAEILKCLLSGPQHYKELFEKVWIKIEKNSGISEKSFQAVILERRLVELENEKIVKRTNITSKNVVFDICDDEKAKEKALAIAYSSLEILTDFGELLKLEAQATNQDLLESFSVLANPLLFPFWRKIIKAIVEKDIENLNFFREQGQQYIASLFGVTVNTLKTEEYRDEAVLLHQSFIEAEKEEKKNSEIKGIRLATRKFLAAPECREFQTQWIKQKVEGMKKWNIKKTIDNITPYSKALTIAVRLGQKMEELNETEKLLTESLKDLDETEKQKIFDLIEIFRKYSGTQKEKG